MITMRLIVSATEHFPNIMVVACREQEQAQAQTAQSTACHMLYKLPSVHMSMECTRHPWMRNTFVGTAFRYEKFAVCTFARRLNLEIIFLIKFRTRPCLRNAEYNIKQYVWQNCYVWL